MTISSSTQTLASLIRAANQARPVVLLGAGASFSSGVPLAAESVRRIARRVFAERATGGAILPEQVKLSEWQTWLQSQSWFIPGEDRLAENFPLIVEHLLHPREYRARLLRDLFQPADEIGRGYRHFADLVMKGLIRTVLTTNFDMALPIALHERRAHIPHVAEVNRGPNDLREFGIFNRAQIVWLHGKAEQYTDRNSAGEVEKLDRALIDLLIPVLTDSPLIVVGYRGAEPSITEHLLARNVSRTQQFKNGIFWCRRPRDSVHPHVEALRRSVGTNFKVLEIEGFDELFAELSEELADEDTYGNTLSTERTSRPLAFDDREVLGASYDDLDHDLTLTVMRDYCVTLGRAPVTADTLPGLLREQGFLVRVNGVEHPTAGCILLFAKDPKSYFPHAVVSATIAGKKRSVFDGNLIRQRQSLLEWLEGDEVNPVLKVKRRATHTATSAYPHRALVELLINLLVHRDYERNETASINVEPGYAITFKNPGGLLESVARQVSPDKEGRFHAVGRRISDLRNRSLCDVFFGIQAMEREGTGLADVELMARGLGGGTSFVHDFRSGSLIAQIMRPVASAGSRTIARDDRPSGGIYVINLLPFTSLPESVSIVRLTTPLWERPAEVSLESLGTFVHRDEELLSFVPLPILLKALAPIVDARDSRAVPCAELEAQTESKRTVSWLLRKHFERHLGSFDVHGFMLEEGRKRRAYFTGRDGKPRKFVYDTPHRKRVVREVVKQRGERPRAWFENEGFGYEFTQCDEVWGVRIKPFYMFTGRDAKTPLTPYARTARATRRMKFDRNKNVEDDLTFWGRFISRATSTINLGQEHVNDLILEGQFVTIEVPEEGLLRDDDEHKDRMPG
jgi:hypothetical protein